MSLEEDVTWLLSICKKPESLKYLEPCAHAFSIFFSLQGKVYSELELAKLSMCGIIATLANMTDKDKFHNLDPQSFLQVANMFLDEEDDGKNYNILISKIIGETNINTDQEGKTDA
jgi:hypothetical protein